MGTTNTDDSDRMVAEIVAGIVEHFDIRPAKTLADLNAGLKFHAHLIRRLEEVAPDLYNHLKMLTEEQRKKLKG